LTRLYVPVLEVALYTSYPLAPVTALQVVLMLVELYLAALKLVGTDGIGLAETTVV